MASHLPAPNAPIPDADPAATITHDDLLDPFFATLHELLRPASPVLPTEAVTPALNNDPTPIPNDNAPAPLPDTDPPAPAPEANPPTAPLPAPPSIYVPTISILRSRPATYTLPPSPRPAHSSSPAPSSSFSHYAPRDPNESYIVFPHEPWKALRGDGMVFGVGPAAFRSEANETTASRSEGSETSGETVSQSEGTPTASPTPPNTPPNPASLTPPAPPPDPALRRPIPPPRARPIPVTQRPASEVSERDPEVIALAVKKTFARMKDEHKSLWRSWVAFRDRGMVEKAFVMRERGRWFNEGHRSGWREIEKRGVCSGKWMFFFFLPAFFFSFLLFFPSFYSFCLFLLSIPSFCSFFLFLLFIVFRLLEQVEWTLRCSS